MNQAAIDCGELAERMARGFYVHAAAMGIATDPRAWALAPDLEPGQSVPVGRVFRKDGTGHQFHYLHFLDQARSDSLLADDLRRIWITGSLLAVGDALGLHHYFDRAPELELLRHLRNGVAHGNRFRIDNPLELSKFPAHNGYAWIKSDTKAVFEITPTQGGQPVLFDFMGPGDILDLLMSISIYLTRMGSGAPLRP